MIQIPGLVAFVAAATAAVFTTSATATAQRTFVASYGNDANPCSRAAPCRSFGAAIAQTDDAGELIVLDSAGYGKVTISKSVTVTAPAGVYAGISVFSGDDGVTVDASLGIVKLRGLFINGQGGNAGVKFVQGIELRIERCEITGMGAYGISATSIGSTTLLVQDTAVADNLGTGIYVNGTVQTFLSNVTVVGNTGNGLEFAAGVNFSVRNSVVDHNHNDGISIYGLVNNPVRMTIDNSRIFGNDELGIDMPLTSIQGASLVISDSEIVRNNMSTFFGTGGVFMNATAGLVGTTLIRTTVNGNGAFGIVADSSHNYIILDNSIVTENGDIGLVVANGGLGYTRGNNVLHHNGTSEESGSIVPLAPH